MSQAAKVLQMLCPNDEWTIYGEEYENILWKDEIVLISKKEFNDGFKKLEKFETDKRNEEAKKKNELLQKLGITEEEARLLLS